MKKFIAIILLATMLTSCSPKPTSNGYPPLLNVDTANDLAFLLNMEFHIAEKFWDKNSVEIIERTNAPKKLTVVLAPGIYIDVGHNDRIASISIVYTERSERDSASLLGLNGYETFDSIVGKFGKENVSPYNYPNLPPNKLNENVSEEMCAVIFSGDFFYRANFDENGVMTDAFISGGI